jgi:pimeloyl-ACP methyl ester carboxylesterase
MSSHIIKTGGAQIAYTDQGSGELTLVFLHYWGGSSRTWENVVSQLESDFKCVTMDHRGWGRSISLNERYDLDSMADDVEDVISALRLKAYILVGHSMGGKVAQIVASRLADRSSTSPLVGMVLVAPAPPDPMEVPAEQRASMLKSYQSREGAEQVVSILAGRQLSEEEREQVIEDTLAGALGAKKEWTEHGMIATVAPRARYTGPVRIVVGELDRIETPNSLKAVFKEHLPQARVKTVPGVGHLLPIEQPSCIVAACLDISSDFRAR